MKGLGILCTTAAAIAICYCADAAAASRAWKWPLDESKYGPSEVNQDYGQWEGIPDSGQHHTGYDIYTDPNTPLVMSPSGGFVTRMSVLDDRGASCQHASPNCSDHGLGNTLIIKHGDKRHPYSQVSHLSSFDTVLEGRIKSHCIEFRGLDENRVYVHDWECPSDAVPVNAGDALGNVGKSGYGDPNFWPARHLHFEAKSVNKIYSLDPTDKRDGVAFGYSAAFPGLLDYVDPLHQFQKHIREMAPLRVTITATGDVPLRLGPDKKYAFALAGSAGQSFWAIRTAKATPGCSLGWYKIAKTSVWPPEGNDDPDGSSYFTPTNTLLRPGLIAATWVCRGQEQRALRITP